MLKKLCNAFGPSGCEDEVREIVLKEITPFCDSVKVDKMGNIIAFKKGKSSNKKFMADAHMDEVGFIIKNITDEGTLKFDEVGGIDPRVLPGKKVLVGDKKIPGVIGVKALHLSLREEREKSTPINKLYIDICASSKEEAESLVSVGDYAVFDSDYVEFGDGFIKAKALDDRAGVFILINMLKKAKPTYDFYAVFSVQEEVGLRGARVAAKEIEPDFALVVESTICADMEGVAPHLQVTSAGDGAVFSVMERTSLANKEMLEFATTVAAEEKIPYQFKRTGSGGNNAGAIGVAGTGVKTLAMAVPCRYLHTSSCVIAKKDLESAETLAIKICERIDEIC